MLKKDMDILEIFNVQNCSSVIFNLGLFNLINFAEDEIENLPKHKFICIYFLIVGFFGFFAALSNSNSMEIPKLFHLVVFLSMISIYIYSFAISRNIN